MHVRHIHQTRPVLVTALAVASLLLAACSASPDEGAPAASVDGQELLEQYGVAIPAATINVGLQPWPDNAVMSIATSEGYYADAGLTLEQENLFVAQDQYIGLLLRGDVDVTADYGPHLIRNAEGTGGEIQMLGVVDATSGIAILAGPGTDYLTFDEAMEESGDFETAVTQVMSQLKNHSFSTDAVGAHRGFVDTVFDLGGLSTDDLSELIAVDDREALLMANGGQVDFVKPEGAAQTAQLLQAGWYPLISLTDVIDNLPPGDPRAVAGLGHVGLSTTATYYEENHDTVLRIAGVMYRVIDTVKADIESGDYSHIESMVPPLEAAASIDTSAEELAVVFGDIGPFWSFEEQEAIWVDEASPWYYATVYNVQIEAAREAGVVQDADLDATDLFIAPEVYAELLQYKQQYEQLLPEADGLTGDAAKLAAIAENHYDARNYLDAARILQAAIDA